MRNNPNLGGFLFLCFLGFLFMMLSISGCTCEAKLARVVKKCPSLLKDTSITIHDTVYSKLVETDTVFNFFSTRDTVVLMKDNVITKYFYNSHDSTVFLESTALPQRITTTRTIKVPVVVYQENVWSFLKSYWWLPLLIILTFFVYLKLKK